eukprot:gnl/Chilomastix_caulleri/7317.p1 GENE.gnl/Chilomastix_caulleri/7317~~gnl/Chilomastix_caulleri/7317.p1  ORF type:complete len:72 (+),score=1.51 gnl/Chilomastix_caulleri/7317:20-235(+)
MKRQDHVINVAVAKENRKRLRGSPELDTIKPLWLLTVCAEGWQIQIISTTPGVDLIPCRECIFWREGNFTK